MKATWEIVAELYGAGDTVEAVRGLTNAELVAVRGFLARDYSFSGVSGMVLGVCLVEEAERFEAALRPPEGGTTNGEEEA